MATVKSTNITNIEASPVVALDGKVGGSYKHIDTISVATTGVDNADDNILIGIVPSNAKITSIKVYNDDLDSNGAPTLAANLGLFYGINNVVSGVKKTSGDVLDADAFATAVTTLQAANTSGVELRFEVADIANIGQEAWQIGGLSEDCGGMLYIGFDLTTAAATAAAGDISVVIEYIV